MGLEVVGPLIYTIEDSDSIDFTLSGQQISAVVKPGGVDHNSLKNVHQDVNTIASPTFAKLIINSDTNGLVLGIDLDATLKWDNANARVDLDKPLAVGGVAGSIFYTNITAPNFISNIAIGTAPYACTSTTLNSNLNADLWEGLHLPALESGKYLTNNGSILSWGTPAGVTDHAALTHLAYADSGHTGFQPAGSYITLLSLSSSATGLTYTNTTGVFSLTSNYVIPTTTEESNWNTAYGWGNPSGVYLPIGGTATNSSLLENHSAAYFQVAGSYQPLHTNLTSLAGMATTVGLVKQTSANTFGIDTTAYYKSGDAITTSNLTDSGLTITRIPYVSTAGLLIDSPYLTFDGTTLTITGTNEIPRVTINGDVGLAIDNATWGFSSYYYYGQTFLFECKDSREYGSRITGYHNSVSPAANDYVGLYGFYGNNSSGIKTYMAELHVRMISVTAGAETSRMGFYTIDTGTYKLPLQLVGAKVKIGGALTDVPTVALDVSGQITSDNIITGTYFQTSTTITANSTGTVAIAAKDVNLLTTNAGWMPIKKSDGTVVYIPYWT